MNSVYHFATETPLPGQQFAILQNEPKIPDLIYFHQETVTAPHQCTTHRNSRMYAIQSQQGDVQPTKAD